MPDRREERPRPEEIADALARSVQSDGADLDPLFRTLLDSARDGVWVAATDGSMTLYVNPAIELIYGRSAGEFAADGDLWLRVIHPDDRARCEAERLDLHERHAVESEYRIVRPDGEVRWVLERKNVIVDGDGAPIGIGGIVTDVTERKRAEQSLRESETRLQLALDALDGGVWEWNVKSGDVHFTPSWSRMLGYEPGEVEGNVKTWESALHPDDRPAVMERLDAHFRRDVPYHSEHRMRTKGGEWIWVLDRGRVVERADDGAPLRMTGTDVNITELKRLERERAELERQVQHAQKLESLGVLAGGIAHDFNNILTGILGNAELALKFMEASPRAERHLDNLQELALRAAELCQQLLAYSGRGQFVVKAFDLSELVRDMTQLLQVSISKKAQLRFELADDLPAIEADVSQLRQVVLNLITNASDALGDGEGTIAVSTGLVERGAAPTVYLEVADDGCGMDDATRARIFDPFFTTKFTGRGLGLAAVQGIVRAHEGSIELSAEPGRGTTFRVLIPACDGVGEPLVSPEHADDDWRGSGTILVVDDEASVRAVTGTIIESRGFDLLAAGDGREALEVFAQAADRIVAVLLDLTMPKMGGQECLRRLRSLKPELKVLLLSGFNEQDVARQVGEERATGFVQKPFRQAELIGKLRALLEG